MGSTGRSGRCESRPLRLRALSGVVIKSADYELALAA